MVSGYTYYLPCGVRYRTLIPSIADNEGWLYFPCRRCGFAHATQAIRVTRPRHRYTPSKAIDEAILKDRIVAALRATWGSVTAEDLAQRHGKQVITVYRIGRNLGVWD